MCSSRERASMAWGPRQRVPSARGHRSPPARCWPGDCRPRGCARALRLAVVGAGGAVEGPEQRAAPRRTWPGPSGCRRRPFGRAAPGSRWIRRRQTGAGASPHRRRTGGAACAPGRYQVAAGVVGVGQVRSGFPPWRVAGRYSASRRPAIPPAISAPKRSGRTGSGGRHVSAGTCRRSAREWSTNWPTCARAGQDVGQDRQAVSSATRAAASRQSAATRSAALRQCLRGQPGARGATVHLGWCPQPGSHLQASAAPLNAHRELLRANLDREGQQIVGPGGQARAGATVERDRGWPGPVRQGRRGPRAGCRAAGQRAA